MVEPYVGEVRLYAFPFAPKDWAVCDGALLSITQNTQLFSIVGTRYGGDGRTTFGLPNLRSGKVVVGAGQGPGLPPRNVGETGGSETVSLTKDQVPTHTHALLATNTPADVSTPSDSTALARSSGKPAYGPATSLTPLHPDAIGAMPAGAQPHNNMMPFLAVNYCIALTGSYPHLSDTGTADDVVDVTEPEPAVPAE